MTSYCFPEDFRWGTATSSYQIEGAIANDGRKPSVWDTFSATPGRVLNGDTGAIACDHYHRYREDIQRMADAGIKHYRFSLSWPRILPEGRGTVNEAGIDFYKRLLDCLHDAGITPYATLFHWDSPQALEDLYGSWQSREIANDFADYVTVVVSRLGDRIQHWITLNEIACFTHLGYGVNTIPPHAPGTVVTRPKAVWQTSHHALLAHGLGCQAIRAASPVPCSVALVDNFIVPVPLQETPDHITATQRAFPTLYANGGIIVPALTGAYDSALLNQLGEECPDVQPGDLEIIHQPLDAIGLNVYSGVYVRAIATEPGYEVLPFPKGYPQFNMDWAKLVPDALYWAVRHVHDTLGRRDLPLWITENGCATKDHLNDRGEVIDSDRILFLRDYLRSAHRAIQEEYPIDAYFAWSLLDNFEWALGYDRRFGLIYVDYEQQTRIPKASFDWYAQCIAQNRIV